MIMTGFLLRARPRRLVATRPFYYGSWSAPLSGVAIRLPGRHLIQSPVAAWTCTRTIVSNLDQQVDRGQLRRDAAQRVAAKKLQRLQSALGTFNHDLLLRQLEEREEIAKRRAEHEAQEEHSNHPRAKSDKVKSANSSDDSSSPPATPLQSIPRGLYIYGPVGTGKSMLMDLFHATSSTPKKQRYHFHAFMNMVHERIHKLKLEALQTNGRNFSIDTSVEHNPVYQVGRQLSKEMTLLCLDEFQVTDIADALILRLLFSVLWSRGTVVVATSNRPPRDLYQGGINYGYFEPFIDLLEKHCIVCAMENDVDYRSIVLGDGQSSFLSLAEHADHDPEQIGRTIDSMIQSLRGEFGTVRNMELSLGHNRSLVVPNADREGIVARFDFKSLCQTELGASDYRRLAHAFDVLVIDNIPVLTLLNHDGARRFITLIDEMYEHQTGLICSAEASTPDSLFIHSFSERDTDEQDDDNIPEGWIDQATRGGHAVGALASVQELGFAFQRAASRLKQMTSPDWWKTKHDVHSRKY